MEARPGHLRRFRRRIFLDVLQAFVSAGSTRLQHFAETAAVAANGVSHSTGARAAVRSEHAPTVRWIVVADAGDVEGDTATAQERRKQTDQAHAEAFFK